jgi:hypothetical protein
LRCLVASLIFLSASHIFKSAASFGTTTRM